MLTMSRIACIILREGEVMLSSIFMYPIWASNSSLAGNRVLSEKQAINLFDMVRQVRCIVRIYHTTIKLLNYGRIKV